MKLSTDVTETTMASDGESVQEAGIVHQGQDVGDAGLWAGHWAGSGSHGAAL